MWIRRKRIKERKKEKKHFDTTSASFAPIVERVSRFRLFYIESFRKTR